jgi:hypothetical protein
MSEPQLQPSRTDRARSECDRQSLFVTEPGGRARKCREGLICTGAQTSPVSRGGPPGAGDARGGKGGIPLPGGSAPPHEAGRFSALARQWNKAGLNKVTRRVAPWMPGLGVVVHRGRRSGRVYQTPVNVFAAPDGYVLA